MSPDSENPPPKSSQRTPPLEAPIGARFSHGHQHQYTNPPETVNPDAATLRDQWRFAIKQYSKWYFHAWGTAILAGVSFFALGWIIKGSNPLASFKSENKNSSGSSYSTGVSDVDKTTAEAEVHPLRN